MLVIFQANWLIDSPVYTLAFDYIAWYYYTCYGALLPRLVIYKTVESYWYENKRSPIDTVVPDHVIKQCVTRWFWLGNSRTNTADTVIDSMPIDWYRYWFASINILIFYHRQHFLRVFFFRAERPVYFSFVIQSDNYANCIYWLLLLRTLIDWSVRFASGLKRAFSH